MANGTERNPISGISAKTSEPTPSTNDAIARPGEREPGATGCGTQSADPATPWA